MFCVRRKGQSTLEYVILIGFVVAALIAMGVYMRRGVQGKLRESADQIGEQYSAGNTTSTYTTKTNINQTENMVSGGRTTVDVTTNRTSKTGNERVADFTPGI